MIRISLMIFSLCLPLLLCVPVSAEHYGPYVGAFVGGNALLTAKGSDSQGTVSLKFDPALLGSAVVGWDFEPGNPVGEGRIELEYSRRRNPLDKITFAEGSFKGGGDVKSDTLLLNLFGVFRDNSRFSPYAGVGIGAARIEASGLQVGGQPFINNGSTVVFAYQAGGGLGFALTNRLDLDLGYRYFSCIRPRFTEVTGEKLEMDYGSHNVVLGLRFGF